MPASARVRDGQSARQLLRETRNERGAGDSACALLFARRAGAPAWRAAERAADEAGREFGESGTLVRRDGVIIEDVVGLADLAAGQSTTLDTVYLWFSMTKIVTATAALQLVERGRMSLDHPVERYFPEFPRPRAGWPGVEVRHLLNHSSGLANPIPVRWVHPADQPAREPRQFTLELLARHRRFRFPARSKASYTNLGYLALGEVIAAAVERSYEDYVRENILAPLGMTRTDFTYRPDMRADAATGYQPRLNPMTPVLRWMLPDGIIGETQGRFLSCRSFCVDGPAYGGLIGPAHDAARFMSAHLNHGRASNISRPTPSRRCRRSLPKGESSTLASAGFAATETQTAASATSNISAAEAASST